MGKPRQKNLKYLKAGDLVRVIDTVHGTMVGTGHQGYKWFEDRHPSKTGEIGIILSVVRRTKRNYDTECIALFGERTLRFQGPYWNYFKRINKE